jgi:uncharacterized protein involved in propanediol utilization
MGDARWIREVNDIAVHPSLRFDDLPAAPATGSVGRSFGTFGELLQGVLPGDNRHFMVTLPVAAWSTARFRYLPDHESVTVRPRRKLKSARVAALALAMAGRPGGGHLDVHSDLPEGKGMASSSADLVATVRAVMRAIGEPVTSDLIESLLRRIEPSDGVMYDEIVEYDHRNVRLREALGVLPSMIVVAYDQGGQVDTIRFNTTMRIPDETEREEYARLLATARDAIRDVDLETVGRVATRSTELNALRTARPALETLQRVCRDIDGLGVVCAHSGTMLGILIHRDQQTSSKVDAALSACGLLPGSVTVHRTLGPGEAWSRGRNAAHPAIHQAEE